MSQINFVEKYIFQGNKYKVTKTYMLCSNGQSFVQLKFSREITEMIHIIMHCVDHVVSF